MKSEYPDLTYFIGWRPFLWKPAVEWLLGDIKRFVGARVLELGCANGLMSCYFGLLGATVIGIDIDRGPLGKAREEAIRWGLSDRVSFCHYDGNPLNIPGNDYDFVFTKSVLVMISSLDKFLLPLSQKIKSGGELMAAENADNRLATQLRRRYKDGPFHGVNKGFISHVESVFYKAEVKSYFSLVTAIRATKSSEQN